MANSVIAEITCPLCGSDCATVHEQERGNKKGRRYIRCYTTAGGLSMRCGTLQCIGPNGQEFIERAIGRREPEPAEVRPIGQPEPKKEQQNEVVPVPPRPIAKRSFVSSLAGLLGEEG